MAKCKMCEKGDFFSRVNRDGICNSCHLILTHRVKQLHRIMSDCMRIIDESKNEGTRLSRCILLLDHLSDLKNYEERGISTIKPSPSVLFEKYLAIRDGIVIKKAKLVVEKELEKANKKSKASAKVAGMNKAIDQLHKIRRDTEDQLHKIRIPLGRDTAHLILSPAICAELDSLEKRINSLVAAALNP